jgi:hypothetical protein
MATVTGWDWRASKRPVDQEWQAVINERGASLCRAFLTAALEERKVEPCAATTTEPAGSSSTSPASN